MPPLKQISTLNLAGAAEDTGELLALSQCPLEAVRSRRTAGADLAGLSPGGSAIREPQLLRTATTPCRLPPVRSREEIVECGRVDPGHQASGLEVDLDDGHVGIMSSSSVHRCLRYIISNTDIYG